MAGDVVADRYELEELVGSGGMSSVFRAHDRVLERTVALKVLHERLAAQKDIVDRFSREARLVARLSHHNIVAVIDRGDHDGRPFIVFEYIAGENLKQLINREGELPVERALELAIEIARGLSYAHVEGFVHRDVKPQNVLLNGKGEPKVTDFGIARSLEVQVGETQTGTVLGTCDYISPEQAQGRPVSQASDVYSLGIVLYELLTAKLPFNGENFVAVAMQHINTEPPPVTLSRPDVPRRVEAAIDKALAKDPASRFATMAAFCSELEACLVEARADEDRSATGILPALKPARNERRGKRSSRGDTKSGRVRGPARRWSLRVVAVLAAAALAAGIAALVFALTRGSGTGGGGPVATGITVKAVAAYDPDGDNHENDPSVSLATDGKSGTFWPTENYRYPAGGLGKAGVGIVLDAGSTVSVNALTVISSTPGYTAEIEAGASPTGPFTIVSDLRKAAHTTTFHLKSADARYYLIWITERGTAPSVHINEVTAG